MTAGGSALIHPCNKFHAFPYWRRDLTRLYIYFIGSIPPLSITNVQLRIKVVAFPGVAGFVV